MIEEAEKGIMSPNGSQQSKKSESIYEYKRFEPAKSIDPSYEIPQSTFQITEQSVDDAEEEDDEDDILNPRNFLSNLYQNDAYIKNKKNMEEQMIHAAKEEVERKNMIEDADQCLKDL